MNLLMRFARFIRIYENFWAPVLSKLFQRPVELDLRNGLRFLCRDIQEVGIVEEVVLDDIYHISEELKKTPGRIQSPTTIDIGANIGAFTVLAASRGAVVFAFEPEPGNFAQLRHNVCLNNLAGFVVLDNRAVRAKSGFAMLNYAMHVGGHFFDPGLTPGRRSLSGGGVKVRTTTLRAILSRYRIRTVDFLKLDCEGSEYEILYVAGADILARIDRIAVECHDRYDVHGPMRRLAVHLHNHGFNVQYYATCKELGMLYAKRRDDSVQKYRKSDMK